MPDVKVNITADTSGLQQAVKAGERSILDLGTSLKNVPNILDTQNGNFLGSGADIRDSNNGSGGGSGDILKDRLDVLNDSIKKATEKLGEAQKSGEWDTVASVSASIERLNAVKRQTTNEIAQTPNTNLPNILAGSANQIPRAVGALTHGDYAGGLISAERNISANMKKAGDSGSGGFSSVLGALGTAGLVVGAVAAGGNALSGAWEDQIPGALELNSRYGNGTSDIDEGTEKLRSAFDKAAIAAIKFGYSAEEGVSLVSGLAKYGVNSDTANGIAENVFQYERGMGISQSMLSDFSGLFERYGMDSGDALDLGTGGAAASGMSRGQTEEFLSSMKNILGDGISKGFILGADEIATNMTMLSRLSGNNPLWSGEQGANRLMGMNNAVAGATALQDSTDIMSFRAANNINVGVSDEDFEKNFDIDKTGTYVDAMMLLEKGVSPELLQEQVSIVKAAEGEDNVTGQIERYRKMFGLNYTGASQLYQMTQGDDWSVGDTADKIKEMQQDPEMASEEQAYLKNMEGIKLEVAKLGQGAFEVKSGTLDGILTTVDDIHAWITKTEEGAKEFFDTIAGDTDQSKILANIYTNNEGQTLLDRSYAKTLGLEMSKDPENEEYKAALKYIESLTDEQRDTLDMSNALNTKDISVFIERMNEMMDMGFDKYIAQSMGNIEEDVIMQELRNIAPEKSDNNWQAQYVAEQLLTTGQGDQDTVDAKIMDLFGSKFNTAEELNDFMNSDVFKGARNAYNQKYNDSGDVVRVNHSDESILGWVQDALNKYQNKDMTALIDALDRNTEQTKGLRYDLNHGTIELIG